MRPPLLAALAMLAIGGACDRQGDRTAAAAQKEALGSVGQPSASLRTAGTSRMASRLALIAENTAPLANVFMNERRLVALRARALAEDPVERARETVELATELLRAGHSEEASEAFLRAITMVEMEPAAHPPGLLRRLRSFLAVTYLRIGEQENCLERHAIDACLLPIRDTGVHRLTRGSEQAVAELERLLADEPTDLISRWLLNIAAMTLGTYPESIPEAWRIPPEALASEDDLGRFSDAAPRLGLATIGLAGGGAVDDFDGDGDLDVVASSWGVMDPLRYFESSRGAAGVLRFQERSEEAGFEGLTGGLNLVHADVDNDGDLDLFVLRGAWLRKLGRFPNSLLINDGQGVFTDQTEEAGLLSFHPTQTAVWCDFDNDGWLDLFVGNESFGTERHPSELYRSLGIDREGQLRFHNVAPQAGVHANGIVKGAVCGDFDNDGLVDLFLSLMRGPNLLFHNQTSTSTGALAFEEVAAKRGVTEPEDAFPAWFFDFDNDGWLDLFVGGYARSFLEARAFQVVADYFSESDGESLPRLYRNLGGEGIDRFADVTVAVGLDHALLAMGANFGDLDNDGWLDLYVGTGAPDFRVLIPNRMFRNDGGKRFRDITSSGGFGHLQKGHAVAFADIDQDGDQDVFSVMGGAFSGDVYQNVLFENPGHGRHWTTLRLEGTTANRGALGARLRLDLTTPTGPRSLHRTVSAGGSFGASSLQQEIGLGDASRIDRVSVQWPGGDKQAFVDLPLDRIVVLRQGEDEPQVVPTEPLRIPPPDAGIHPSPGP